MRNPQDMIDLMKDDEATMMVAIDRLQRVKQLFEKNSYTGKYRDDFSDVYEDILDAKDIIEKEFENGFQFGDLENILVTCAPILKGIYNEFYDTLKDDKEAEAFLADLIIFIYYEVEDKINSWGWLKGILRIVLRLYIAKQAAKYLKIAFDYADGNISVLTDKVMNKIQKYLDMIN